MKKLFSPVLALAMCTLPVVFSSCCNDDGVEKFTMEELENYNYKKVPIKEIGSGSYLYEVSNDDYWTKYYYNPLTLTGEFNGLREYHGVCAGVRNGNFFGRNLDWSCSELPEFVVHTPAKNGRHATLGICSTNLIKQLPEGQDWISQVLVNDLTLNCYDGINDAGVCMVLLVLHYDDGGGEPTGTNPTAATTIHGANLLRYVLDYANSAEHGVQLMKSVNTYGTLEHYTFHWMLSDEKDNYFVELMNNQLVATKVEENPIAKFRKPIITNFYLQKDTTEQMIPGGIERYEILNKEYDKTASMSGMFDVLEKVRFSRKYNGKNPATLAEGEADLNWYSEFYSYMPDPYTFMPVYNDKKSSRQKMWDEMISKDIELNDISKWLPVTKTESPRKHPMTSWTLHTSVYNIKERTMQVVTGEAYDKVLPTATTCFTLTK